MSKVYLPLLVTCVVALSTVQAGQLFLDTFQDNATTGSEDVNVDLDGGRQSGTLSNLQYWQGVNGTGGLVNESSNGFQTQVDNSGTAHSLWLVGVDHSYASVSPDYNFALSPGVGKLLSIRTEITPGNSGWAGITFGASDNANFGTSGAGARGQFILGNYEMFGFLLGQNGYYEFFEDGVKIDSGNLSTGGTHQLEFQISGLVDGNPFDGSNDAYVEVFVDDSTSPILSRVISEGLVDNYITLLGYSEGFDIHEFHELEVGILDSPSKGTFIYIGSISGWLLLALGLLFRRDLYRSISDLVKLG